MSSKQQANDVVFDLDAASFSSDTFRIYSFKVKRCPRARPHDWTQCPFAHPGEKAKRRCPKRYRYSGTACPEFRRNGCCRRADACPFAHGVFECWLHPTRYRTQMCTDGVSCKRRVCFFAHAESELRKPEEDPVWLQQQMQAEMAAEQQAAQQSQALKMFSQLLNQTSQAAATEIPTPPAGASQNGLEAFKAVISGLTAATASSASATTQQSGVTEDPLQLLQQALQGTAVAAPAQAAPVNANSVVVQLLQLLGVGDKALPAASSALAAQTAAPIAAAPLAVQPLPQLLAGALGASTATTDAASSTDVHVKVLQQLVQQLSANAATAPSAVPAPAPAPTPAPAPAPGDITQAAKLLEALTMLQQQGVAGSAAPAASLTAQLQQLTLAAAALEGQKADMAATISAAPVSVAASLPAEAMAQALLAATGAAAVAPVAAVVAPVPVAATVEQQAAALLAAAAAAPPAGAVTNPVTSLEAVAPVAAAGDLKPPEDPATALAALIAGLTAGTADTPVAAAGVVAAPAAGTSGTVADTATTQQEALRNAQTLLGILSGASATEVVPGTAVNAGPDAHTTA